MAKDLRLEALIDLYGPEFPVERQHPPLEGMKPQAQKIQSSIPRGEPRLSGSEEKIEKLLALNQNEIIGCSKCSLSQKRVQTVFGEGDVDAEIVFIGEGPGVEEDKTGRPFVGPAGLLLDKMISAMGLSRKEVFICNTVKCHPPGTPPVQNRPPHPEEIKSCLPFLEYQLKVISPKCVVSLGRVAAGALDLGSGSLASLRGTTHHFGGFPVRATYHPSALLRQGPYQKKMKKAAWDDLKVVLNMVGRTVPGAGSQNNPKWG